METRAQQEYQAFWCTFVPNLLFLETEKAILKALAICLWLHINRETKETVFEPGRSGYSNDEELRRDDPDSAFYYDSHVVNPVFKDEIPKVQNPRANEQGGVRDVGLTHL